jgi:hypothetical protein
MRGDRDSVADGGFGCDSSVAAGATASGDDGCWGAVGASELHGRDVTDGILSFGSVTGSQLSNGAGELTNCHTTSMVATCGMKERIAVMNWGGAISRATVAAAELRSAIALVIFRFILRSAAVAFRFGFLNSVAWSTADMSWFECFCWSTCASHGTGRLIRGELLLGASSGMAMGSYLDGTVGMP